VPGFLRRGDVLMVMRIDRLARGVGDRRTSSVPLGVPGGFGALYEANVFIHPPNPTDPLTRQGDLKPEQDIQKRRRTQKGA
jgi:hypothetical protein